MADINDVIAAHQSQMQRAFHQGSRGIATPEQRAAWRREAVAAIDAVADRAWHEGGVVLAGSPPHHARGRGASVTAIDRQQIIEDLARAWTDSSEGAQMWDGWAGHVDHCPEGDACDSVILHDIVTDARRDATAALPVIVAAALKPIRDMHAPIDAADYTGGPFRRITQVCTACGTDDGNWQRHPCPTVRLLDQIEAAVKGGE